MHERKLKVAIVHDWLVGGGAEKVVLELHRLYPEAPIYTSYCTNEWREKLDGKVTAGLLQNWPFSRLRKYIPPLRIWWFSRLNLEDFDLVISSSGNGEAKGIHASDNAKHIWYCHSPTHFYWRHYEVYLKNPGFGIFNSLARLGLKTLVGPLKKWDFQAAQNADIVIANSTHIQNDIEKYYQRKSVVVFPPVDVERFALAQRSKLKDQSYFVTAGRMVPHKHTEVIIEACTKLGLPLKVIGKGPELENLKKLAGLNVEFLGFAADEELPDLFAGAKAFLFASFEDFGVVPVEAMAAGTPVIAYRAGGALDYVIPGKTGEFFDEQNARSLASTLENFNPSKYSSGDIKSYVEKFSVDNFHQSMSIMIQKALQ
jgi:glycosyltransferase involved in cell wall biosynthesis